MSVESDREQRVEKLFTGGSRLLLLGATVDRFNSSLKIANYFKAAEWAVYHKLLAYGSPVKPAKNLEKVKAVSKALIHKDLILRMPRESIPAVFSYMGLFGEFPFGQELLERLLNFSVEQFEKGPAGEVDLAAKIKAMSGERKWDLEEDAELIASSENLIRDLFEAGDYGAAAKAYGNFRILNSSAIQLTNEGYRLIK